MKGKKPPRHKRPAWKSVHPRRERPSHRNPPGRQDNEEPTTETEVRNRDAQNRHENRATERNNEESNNNPRERPVDAFPVLDSYHARQLYLIERRRQKAEHERVRLAQRRARENRYRARCQRNREGRREAIRQDTNYISERESSTDSN